MTDDFPHLLTLSRERAYKGPLTGTGLTAVPVVSLARRLARGRGCQTSLRTKDPFRRGSADLWATICPREQGHEGYRGMTGSTMCEGYGAA